MNTNHPKDAGKGFSLMGWFVLLSGVTHGIFLAIPAFDLNETLEENINLQLSTPLQVTVISSRPANNSSAANSADEKPVSVKNINLTKTAFLTTARSRPLSIKAEQEVVNDNNESPSSNNIEKNMPTQSKAAKTEVHGDKHSEFYTENNKLTAAEQNNKVVPLNNLRQQLKNIIRARFTYPRMARRMGWEGLVGLSLHIDDDGSLNNVRIARSSGRKVLDDNAKKTIQSIGRLQLASNLTIQAADTEIEVLYRLTD
jgi:TonB family protein